MHDEELGTGRVRMHGSCHGENAGCMLQRIVKAILGKFTLDGVAGATGSDTLGAAALDHEASDDTVENQTVVEALVHQADEVVYGIGGDFRIKLCFDEIAILHFKSYNGILCHNTYLLF